MSVADRDVFVLGVGMTKFEKPGRRDDFDYPEMALEAGTKALSDADIAYTQIEQAFVGYVYGDSTCGQRALYQLGMTAIPIVNVNNNCSTGSTALFLAWQLIRGGQAHCALALGFEKMQRGSLQSQFSDRTNPMDRHVEMMCDVADIETGPMTAQMFGNAAREHMKKYGTTRQQVAKIAWKNHKHSVNNPYSQFRDEYTLQQILDSASVHDPLTKLQCCPTSDGGAAAVLVSGQYLRTRASAAARSRAVRILDMQLATDPTSSLSHKSCIKMVGYDMTKIAVDRLLAAAQISIADVQVIELHDCFSANELITYEALGLCPEGGAGRFIDSGDNSYGGKFVVNPSGGLISKGHPLGATGLAQCAELCWQVRGEAGLRQVTGARTALQHNIGLGGAVVVALYQLLNLDNSFRPPPNSTALKNGGGLKSTEYFHKIQRLLDSEGQALRKMVNGAIEFRVFVSNHEMARWTVDLSGETAAVTVNSTVRPDLTLSVSDDDLTHLLTGRVSPEQALDQLMVTYTGDSNLAPRLNHITRLLHHSTAKL